MAKRRMAKKNALLVFCIIWCGSCAKTSPGAELVVGDSGNYSVAIGRNLVILAPNTSSQPINVYVSGSDQAAGFNLVAQINEGGQSSIEGPVFGSVDLKPTGGIFSDAADEPFDLGSSPQLAQWSIALFTPGDSRPADGLLATIEINTTGLSSGSWPLLLGSDAGPGGVAIAADSDFAGVAATNIINAQLTIAGLAGDYNSDGMVSAADYPVWRNSLGQTGVGLPADGTGEDLLGIPDGVVDTFDYQFWKLHYGETLSIGSPLADSSANVPEPPAVAMACLAIVALVPMRRRRATWLPFVATRNSHRSQ